MAKKKKKKKSPKKISNRNKPILIPPEFLGEGHSVFGNESLLGALRRSLRPLPSTPILSIPTSLGHLTLTTRCLHHFSATHFSTLALADPTSLCVASPSLAWVGDASGDVYPVFIDGHGMHRGTAVAAHIGTVQCMAAAGAVVASGGHDRTVRLFRVRDGGVAALAGTLDDQQQASVTCLSVAQGRVLVGDGAGVARLFDAEAAACEAEFGAETGSALGTCHLIEGARLAATCGKGQRTLVWDLRALEVACDAPPSQGVAAHGHLLYVPLDSSPLVSIYDRRRMDIPVSKLKGAHRLEVSHVAVSEDGVSVVTTSTAEKGVAQWQGQPPGDRISSLSKHAGELWRKIDTRPRDGYPEKQEPQSFFVPEVAAVARRQEEDQRRFGEVGVRQKN